MEQSSHAAKLALHAGPSEQFWKIFGTILKLVKKRVNFPPGFCVQVMEKTFQYLLKKGKF